MDSKLILQLRDLTGAGIVEAKKVLEEVQGDVQKAVEALRKKGLVKAAGKAERQTAEGLVHSYIHSNGKVGSLVEVLCETDFVAKTDTFRELCHDIAMHVAASNPLYLNSDGVPADVLAKEKEIWTEEFGGSGKPQSIVDKILEGKASKYYSETCLLKQSFVKDEDVTVAEHIGRAIAKLGENIRVRRFVRFSLAEK